MEKGTQTMIDNLSKNTGKTLEQWISIVHKKDFAKHGEVMKYLKEEHSLTHGFANLIALKSKGSDAGSAVNQDDLITKQYQGKEHFKPLYDKLLAEILKFGKDIEIAPKNAYVSLKRKKQFAMLQPATKTRFEIGIILKGQPAQGRLESISQPNAMFSHRINLTSLNDINKETIEWLKTAYTQAG